MVYASVKDHVWVEASKFLCSLFFVVKGRGTYESRAEMLRLIVDLVEASCFADNPEWR